MPTASRLVAALLTAALGWGVAQLVPPYLPEGYDVGWFFELCAGFGLLTGWLYTGRQLDRGLGRPLNVGVASAAVLVFWILLTLSTYEMVVRSLRRRYDGPTEALQGVIEIALEYLAIMAHLDVIGALLLGALWIAVITYWVGRRFP